MRGAVSVEVGDRTRGKQLERDRLLMESQNRELSASDIAITPDGCVIVCESEAEAACAEAVNRKYKAFTEGVYRRF